MNKDWIVSIPKTINSNGCWISNYKPQQSGYIKISKGGREYYLHRLSMCIYNNIEYLDKSIETRHSTGCNRACFNPEHLKPGTALENQLDSVRDKTHWQAKKDKCPTCGTPYRVTKPYKRLPNKFVRFCPKCRYESRQRMFARRRLNK